MLIGAALWQSGTYLPLPSQVHLRLSWLSCRHLDLQHHFLLKANIVPTKKDQPMPVSDLFPQAWQPFFLFVDRSTILRQFLPLKFTTRTVLFTVRRCDWFDFDFSTKRLTFLSGLSFSGIHGSVFFRCCLNLGFQLDAVAAVVETRHSIGEAGVVNCRMTIPPWTLKTRFTGFGNTRSATYKMTNLPVFMKVEFWYIFIYIHI